MNILIIGAGGREHALAWKIRQSDLCDELFIAPGNAGTANCGINLSINSNDFEGLKQAALDNNIQLIVVGPEEPLVKGVVDYFISNPSTQHINIIGPDKFAAQLEGSKAFAKAFMSKYKIPTAAYQEFTVDNYEDGIAYINHHQLPIVLKADGLAAGKGVLICNSHDEALSEFKQMMLLSKFGDAGNKIVIEQYLEGIEMSVFVLTDGHDYLLLPEAKDYKRIGEGDSGLNTGGMGAVSPLSFFDEALKDKIIKTIVHPTIQGIQQEKFHYKGFVFIGLMINNGEPYVIEYNCRLGDPETEVVIPRIKNDFVEMLLAAATGKINSIKINTDPRAAVAIVAVSEGYPGPYNIEKKINGLNNNAVQESMFFHSGTAFKNNDIVTNGGRVLAVTAFGKDIKEAASISKEALQQIHFEGIYFRSDIGYEFY